MKNDVRALHLHSAPSTLARDVETWLATHRVATVALPDAFAACCHLLSGFEQPPEFAFVGVDRLATDERQIIRFIRETWPATIIVLYGSDVTAPWSADPLLVPTDNREALAALLALTPAAFAAQIRRTAPRPPARTTPAASTATLPAPPRQPTPSTQANVLGSHGGASATRPQHSRPVLDIAPLEPAGASLTAEELAALLDAGHD